MLVRCGQSSQPGGGSVPPSVLVTNLRPDIFIVNESTREVIVFELTCPWDNNIARSHSYNSWAVLKLLTSVHLGKIVDLHKNDKSYNIFINFFMEKHKILPQFDDLTS